MCGICAIIAKNNVVPELVEGLRRLEYRGYDSAGIAVINSQGRIQNCKAAGKLKYLEEKLLETNISGMTGIGHTRWATHGAPVSQNAHPHCVGAVAVVHNGIIENYQQLKEMLEADGRIFNTETDTEVVAHLIDSFIQKDFQPFQAVQKALKQLEGAYALSIIFDNFPNMMIGARHGAPLAVGYADSGVVSLGSDSLALVGIAEKLSYLEDGDIVLLETANIKIFDKNNKEVQRPIVKNEQSSHQTGKAGYKHYMEKEIYEHATSIARTDEFLHKNDLLSEIPLRSEKLKRLVISACGSAYYAGLVGKYWLENLVHLSVEIDVASELRYRKICEAHDDAMAILISQSGETADTLAALRHLKALNYPILGVLNSRYSTMERESDTVFLTQGGPEISVASTKAFTAQLTVLANLAIALGRERKTITKSDSYRLQEALSQVPAQVTQILSQLASSVDKMAEIISRAQDVLFLGRNICMPIAEEGALKLKEITYIHAEAYPAGELKHGPISLIDPKMPIVALAPSGILFEKTLSNLQEVKARGGRLLVFTDEVGAKKVSEISDVVGIIPSSDPFVVPFLYTVPLHMLSYKTALLKGTDVDQPRNLAKSVTVE
ncbi:glutamine--fructose-6-phosphate transaminase (isomerizing) [Acetobacteraceae bacterium]|nr:glutamine--fructose-6-phosphate transaminase (isomerizing) [Acetobacteraceae bacterium]